MSFRRAMARGFTLIEMAIVLVVIGLVLSGGLLAVNPVIQGSRVTETVAKLQEIEKALLVYGIQYTCLPCPADGSIATGAANYGQSQDTGGVVAGNCTNNACITANGVVPWLTLGISEADVTDPWGNRITYQLSSDNTVTACTDGTGFGTRNGTLQRTSGFARTTVGSAACYPLGRINIQDTAGNNIVTGGGAAEGAAFVLVSHGPDGEGARASSTGALRTAAAGLADQVENADGDAVFVQDDPVDVGATYFDDIVRWRTAPLLVQLCGNNACGNPA